MSRRFGAILDREDLQDGLRLPEHSSLCPPIAAMSLSYSNDMWVRAPNAIHGFALPAGCNLGHKSRWQVQGDDFDPGSQFSVLCRGLG